MDEEQCRLEDLLTWALGRVRIEGWRGTGRARYLWSRIQLWKARLEELEKDL